MTKVCERCYSRKVRCEREHDGPCTKCVDAGVECITHVRKVRKNKANQYPDYVRKTDPGLSKILNEVQVDPAPHLKRWKREKSSMAFVVRMNGLPALQASEEEEILDGIIDDVDYNTLMNAGCFNLPSMKVCWELIKVYFSEVYPSSPILDKDRFMAEYRDLTKGPSILLLQTILFAGAFTCYRRETELDLPFDQITDISFTLYRRARLLLNMGFDLYNAIPLMQSLVIFNSVPSGFGDGDTAYQLKQAITTCCSFGMHLDQSENKQLTDYEKYMYRLIWAQLFITDHSRAIVASFDVTLRRSGCTAKMFTRDELYTLDNVQKDYFLFAYELSLIVEKLASYLDTVTQKMLTGESTLHLSEEAHSLLQGFYISLPPQLRYDKDRPKSQNSLSALLSMEYFAALISINRFNSVRAIKSSPLDIETPELVTSWEVTYQASWSIYQIYQSERSRLGCTCLLLPLAHCSYAAAVTMTYHFRNTNPEVVERSHEVVNGVRGVLLDLKHRCPVVRLMYEILTKIQENESYQLMVLYKILQLEMEESPDLVLEKLNTFA